MPQGAVVVAVRVVGMGDGLADLELVDGLDGGQVATHDPTARQQERRLVRVVQRELPVREVVAEAPAELGPFRV
jgi:hypothetical protein